MEKKQKKEKAESRINQFIIECMFNKYFEEEKEIASPLTSFGARNDEAVGVSQ